MNLDQCLSDVENGIAGEEHAEWLGSRIDWLEKALGRWDDKIWEKHSWAKLWKRAAKKWYSLATIGGEYAAENSQIADEFLAQRNEARDWAIRLKRERDEAQKQVRFQNDNWRRCADGAAILASERDKLQTQNIQLKQERNEQERLREMKYHRNKELLAEVQELRKEIETLKEQRCETCVYALYYMDTDWICARG